jgi:hypothetical protein
MSTIVEAPLGHLEIRPWPDAVIDRVGHDPRSPYVERFWLSILGPSTTWLLRRLAAGFEESPSGFELDLRRTARALGLGSRNGPNAPFTRALVRCRQFGFAQEEGPECLAVRRKLPPLSKGQVDRLPDDLRAEHHHWQTSRLRAAGAEEQRRRARRLALSLFELGESLESAERQLHRWRFHPALAHDAVAWAWDRHRIAAKAAARLHDAGDDGQPHLGGDVA